MNPRLKALFRPAAAGCVLMLAAACASTPTPYQPENKSGLGFSEQKIETGRYTITFTANSRETAERYALRRAAELTLAEGGSWFEVTNAYFDGEQRSSSPRTSVGVGVGGGSGRVSSGVGVGINLGSLGGEKVTRSLSILIGSGEVLDGANFYDAEDVLMNTAGPAG